MTSLMTDRLAMAKEGYEYLIDVCQKPLTAAGEIEVHELVEYIEQHTQSGSNRKIEERIQELERDLQRERGDGVRQGSGSRLRHPGQAGGGSSREGVFVRGEHDRGFDSNEPV